MKPTIDPLFRIEVLSQMPSPQQLIYAAMHTDYAEEFVFDELRWGEFDPFQSYKDGLTESKCGELIVKHLLKGDRGHYGCVEHPQIAFNCGWFPHSVIQQLRTHRVGISFDVQSFRYSGTRLLKAAIELKTTNFLNKAAVEEVVSKVIYLRPVGIYTDRQGKHYEYTQDRRLTHLRCCIDALEQYASDIAYGMSEEHARSFIPFDVRQHFVVSCNARSLMHLLDLRAKKDAQLECQWFCDLLLPHFEAWCPEIADWYKENRLGKARLSP